LYVLVLPIWNANVVENPFVTVCEGLNNAEFAKPPTGGVSFNTVAMDDCAVCGAPKAGGVPVDEFKVRQFWFVEKSGE
jgi:hypothetical protein